jgi:hypothetical protein
VRSIQDSPFWELIGAGHSGQSNQPATSENVDLYLYKIFENKREGKPESERVN